ncbi:MAG TPA: 2Fe-2S iron-sulfur cluster-binding protein [Planctomycetota bacterium]
MPKVRFLRSGVEVECEQGANLRQVALKAGVQIYEGPHKVLNCHGLSQCGSCRVLLQNGTESAASAKGMMEKARMAVAFFNIGHGNEMRLSCQTKVMGDLDVMERPPSNFSGTYAPEADAARRRLRQGKL